MRRLPHSCRVCPRSSAAFLCSTVSRDFPTRRSQRRSACRLAQSPAGSPAQGSPCGHTCSGRTNDEAGHGGGTMREQIDEALLVAYVDGELDTEATRVVEAMLDTNAGARQYVSELRESAALLRGAFHDKPTTPIPNRLVEIINGAGTTPQALRRPDPPRWIWAERRRPPMPTSLAASHAAAAICASSGHLFSA